MYGLSLYQFFCSSSTFEFITKTKSEAKKTFKLPRFYYFTFYKMSL